MKILLTGNTFHGYDVDLKNALLELDHEVVELFNNIHGPYNQINNVHKKWAYGILPQKLNFNYLINLSIAEYNKKLIQLNNTIKFDLIIFIGAKTVTEKTLSEIKSKKVLWFMDGVKYYEKLLPKFNYFEHVFIFEPTDLNYLKENNIHNVSILNLGFNKKRFFPIQDSIKYDFSFVGSYYPNREEILNFVNNNNSNGVIYGDFKKSIYPKLKAVNAKSQINIKQTNSLFNQSFCNLNIHHPQSIEGLNVRTFEILGSGNLQFVENKKNALDFFEDGKDLIFYDSKEELLEKIQFYLSNKSLAENIRINGYNNAIKYHTWTNRMEQLIKISKKQ